MNTAGQLTSNGAKTSRRQGVGKAPPSHGSPRSRCEPHHALGPSPYRDLVELDVHPAATTDHRSRTWSKRCPSPSAWRTRSATATRSRTPLGSTPLSPTASVSGQRMTWAERPWNALVYRTANCRPSHVPLTSIPAPPSWSSRLGDRGFVMLGRGLRTSPSFVPGKGPSGGRGPLPERYASRCYAEVGEQQPPATAGSPASPSAEPSAESSQHVLPRCLARESASALTTYTSQGSRPGPRTQTLSWRA